MPEIVYVSLSSLTGRHFFTETEWKTLLQLARDYGWLPAGTLPPTGRNDLNWDQTYFPAQGQTISAEDGGRFAVSLERALQDIPAEPELEISVPLQVSPASLTALSYYRGPRRALLQRLAASGHAGTIQIQPHAGLTAFGSENKSV